MAAPTITLLNHTELHDADVDDGGWFNLATADSDIKVEGIASMSGITRADQDLSYYDASGAPITAVGKTLRGWVNTTNMPYMQPESLGGYELYCYDSSVASDYKTIFGSDTYFGGWFNFIQDMDAFTTVTLANVDRWGIRANHTGNSKNVINMWMDVLRYLDGYSMTGGTTGDRIDLAAVELYDRGTTPLRGYGVVTQFGGVYYCTGTVQFGTGATTMWFEMDGEVLVFLDAAVVAGLYSLAGVGSGSTVVIQNSVIRSSGTTDATRFVFDWSDTGLASCSITDNLITRAAAVTFKSGQTITGNTFDDCGQATHGGADMNNCVFKNYEGTAGTAALLYDVNADPAGEVDGMSFTKGTATTHAIELGTNTPSDITLIDWTTSGYNPANGNNDSTIYNNSGKAITINVEGGTGNFTYRNGTSATTTIVADPVTTLITVKDINTQALLEDARVLLIASDDTGDFPYQEVVTSINRVTTTATVAHTGHGMATGDFVFIEDADQDEYNGAYEITVTTVDEYTYQVDGTPTTPATGTILATGGFFNTLTSASGIVTDSRTISKDQPVTGRARLSTSPDLYKSSPINETVDKDIGLSVTVQLIPDG